MKSPVIGGAGRALQALSSLPFAITSADSSFAAERPHCVILQSYPEYKIFNICTETVSAKWSEQLGVYNLYGAELRSGECYPVFRFVYITACDKGERYLPKKGCR